MLFSLGSILVTSGALQALAAVEATPSSLCARHASGDWGTVSESDQFRNEQALYNGERLMSVYPLSTGETVWVMTESDRSLTTVLLPDEY